MVSLCQGRFKCIVFVVAAAALLAAIIAVVVVAPWRTTPPARFARAAVAANGHECAGIGREILEKDGSAVDAMIAMLFCQGITCAQCMGLGGGFLATVYDAPTRQIRAMNAREKAPALAHRYMYENASSTVGGMAVAVPGELRGYGELYKAYGRLPWRELVQPSIDLSIKGHRVSPYQAQVLISHSDLIKEEPSMRDIYLNPATGEVWQIDDLLPNPTFARTLEVIAAEGPEALNNGTLTALLAQDIQDAGGIVTEDDLRNFQVEWQTPITVALNEDETLYSSPLPGSGGILAFILNMLNGYVGEGTDAPPGSPLYYHRIVEAFKFAYAKRTGMGDPNRPISEEVPYSIYELERNLTEPSWAAQFRSLVNDTHTSNDWRAYGGVFDLVEDHGTAHSVVIAPDGSVVSVTSTVNFIWGAKRVAPHLGFILNNEMDDFAIPNQDSGYGLPPSPANFIEPGLRPLSSMVPSIVLRKDGTVSLVIGGAGGTRITTQLALTVTYFIHENDDFEHIIARPRIHHQLIPMVVSYESTFDHEVISSLEARDHVMEAASPTAGFAALVGAARDADGYLIPQTDPRRIGSVDGL